MGDRWEGELKVLIDLVEHHVDEEESTEFSCARDEFDKEQLEAMREEFQTRKAQLGTKVASPSPQQKGRSGSERPIFRPPGLLTSFSALLPRALLVGLNFRPRIWL